MYTVIGSFRSRAFRVLWAVEELGLDYEHLPESPRSESVLKHNPSGKIPVLLDDGEAVTDSTAIMTYLADKHGALTFAAGTLNRARQDAWTNQILDDIDAVLWTAARHSFILPEEMRLPAIKDSLKWEYERNLKRITDRLDGPFLMGETMTIADILLAHCGGWAHGAGFVPENETFKTYLKAMRARPAFRKLTEKMAA
jgi:glutathione S-transferase